MKRHYLDQLDFAGSSQKNATIVLMLLVINLTQVGFGNRDSEICF